ncbi:MAG: hypothetical protein ACLUZ6_02575 [Lachnospira eligens]
MKAETRISAHFLTRKQQKICKCEASRAWWNVERRVRKAEARCLEVADSEYIGEVLKSSVRPIMKSEFDRLTIKDGGLLTVCTWIMMREFMSGENIRSRTIKRNKRAAGEQLKPK